MTASTCIYYLFHHIANDSMSKIQFQCVILIVFLHILLLLPWGLVERVPACCKSSKFPHPVHAAFQPITNSSRQKHSSKLSSERERAAFSSNLQSHSCLYPPLPFLSISLPFISRCNQLLLSEVFAPQTSQAARSPALSPVEQRGGRLARGHRPPVAESCT